MKRILYLICAGSMVFALNALAAPEAAPQKGKKGGAASAHVAAPAKGRGTAMRGGGTAHVRTTPARMQRSVARAPARGGHEFTRSSHAVVNRNAAHTRREAGVVQARAARERVRTERGVAATRESQLRATREQTAAQRRVATAQQRGTAWRTARHGNIGIVNTWRSNRFSGSAYAPFRNYTRVYHDSGWYHSHYGGDSLTFVLGGWWFWNAGYWYPAWGYAPYSYYPYDGPIYTGYASLRPNRVVVEVQRQLRSDGYYAGPIDGSLGPMTRRALAAFQADNGLAITSAIDQPTLSTLGIS